MGATDEKEILHHYLRSARAALVWKLDGVSEYDVRRPLTPTGSNLLGIVKHLASVELGYLGDTFGRPHEERFAWDGREQEPNEDMYATAAESREDVLALYRRANDHGDATIDALDLSDTGTVPWWPDDVNPVSLQWIIVHLIAETNRHVGQVDVLREGIDGAAGLRADGSNLPDGDEAWWADYVERVEREAQAASGERPEPSG